MTLPLTINGRLNLTRLSISDLDRHLRLLRAGAETQGDKEACHDALQYLELLRRAVADVDGT